MAVYHPIEPLNSGFARVQYHLQAFLEIFLGLQQNFSGLKATNTALYLALKSKFLSVIFMPTGSTSFFPKCFNKT
jgi:hypothetical protein